MNQTLPQTVTEPPAPPATPATQAAETRLVDELPPAVIVVGIGLSTALFLTTYYFLNLMAAMFTGLLLIIFLPATAFWLKRFLDGEYVLTVSRWRANWHYLLTYYAEKWNYRRGP